MLIIRFVDAIYCLGVTLTYSWGVSVIYPIIASYSAFDGYSSLASKSAALTLQFGGVTIPVGTVLKKMTTEAPIEEDELSTRLMIVQMWMIYWIVNSCVGVIESVLFLTYLPLYSILRLCFSVWLISPIVLTVALSRGSGHLLEVQIKSKWTEFFSLGCGLVFSRVLKPFMDDKLKNLKLVDADHIVNGMTQFLKFPIANIIAYTKSVSSGPDGTWTVSGLSTNVVRNLFSVFTFLTSEQSEVGARDVSETPSDIDDFDVIDSPLTTGEDKATENLSHRKVGKHSYFHLWPF